MTGEGQPFDDIWQRIVASSGEFFKTQAGEWFTYRMDGAAVRPSHSEALIPRTDFELVFPMLPLPAPAKVGKFVTGSKWLWAILHDERIRKGEW